MSGTSTPEVGFYKPAAIDNVNVTTDLDDNWDRADLAIKGLRKKNVCVIRLTGTVGLVANTDTFAETGWAVESDPNLMANLSSVVGTKSYILIPKTCRYTVLYTSNYDTTTAGVVNFVTKNSPAVGNSVARDSKPVNTAGGDGTWTRAFELPVLTAGDKLYWGNFTQNAGNLRATAIALDSKTRITIAEYDDN